MKCKCGFDNAPDAKFCGNCGMVVEAKPASPIPSATEPSLKTSTTASDQPVFKISPPPTALPPVQTPLSSPPPMPARPAAMPGTLVGKRPPASKNSRVLTIVILAVVVLAAAAVGMIYLLKGNSKPQSPIAQQYNEDLGGEGTRPLVDDRENEPQQATKGKEPPADIPGRYPEGSERLLSSYELKSRSPFELKIMRNEIFARHGYRFNTDDMKSYFSNQNWYVPQYDDINTVSDMLSSIEKKNAQVIQDCEREEAIKPKLAVAPTPAVESHVVQPPSPGKSDSAAGVNEPETPKVTYQDVGSVVQISQDWGFAAVRLGTGISLKPGDTVYVRDGAGLYVQCAVKKIAGSDISIMPVAGANDLNKIKPGMSVVVLSD